MSAGSFTRGHKSDVTVQGAGMSRLVFLLLSLLVPFTPCQSATDRPNIFIAISDDVSWPHASAYGSNMVSTPAFDQVAAAGVLFHNAFCPAPGCSPSRAAFLTGRHIWMIEEAGIHASYFQKKYRTFPEQLQDAGYFVGSTGKAWGPGDFRHNGREHNPAGKQWQVSRGNYVEGFRQFLAARPDGRPFCFWFGSHDAHRQYEKSSGVRKGLGMETAEVPSFLPDHPEIRRDLLDYAFEIERFDNDCRDMLQILEDAGELDNTLVIVTSDNGMPFPRAKANCYEFGVHVPLAICWKNVIPGNREITDLIDFTDLTCTIYRATGVSPPAENPPSGSSLLESLKSERDGQIDSSRTVVYFGRERHSSSRFNSLSYPQRAIRTPAFLYIINLKSERWPAGAPRKFKEVTWRANGTFTGILGPEHGGYHDIDSCPTLEFLIEKRDDPRYTRYLSLSVARRPAEELFDIRTDPGCIRNLATEPDHAETKSRLRRRLLDHLATTGDPRMTGNGDVWETYPRVSRLRWFDVPDWAAANPARVPTQAWLEARRPRSDNSSVSP